MKKIIPLFLISLLFFSSCSIDWNDENDKRIEELSMRVSQIEKGNHTTLINSGQTTIPQYSFRVHLIQFGGIHSKLYDGVFWELSREGDFPDMDSSIQDLSPNLISIDYRGRKDFFIISCPANFQIRNCSQNNFMIDPSLDNSCNFYFSDEGKNTDIMFNCVNDKLKSGI